MMVPNPFGHPISSFKLPFHSSVYGGVIKSRACNLGFHGVTAEIIADVGEALAHVFCIWL
jgi:hypothetical protein